MLTMKLNMLKFKSLEEYCKQYNLKCKYITENTYDISKYNLSYILDFIEKKLILMNVKNLEKLKRNLL